MRVYVIYAYIHVYIEKFLLLCYRDFQEVISKVNIVESEIENKMRQKLKAHGGIFFKFVSPSVSGVPDRICILPHGRIIFVELKREGGVVSPRQKYIHKKLRHLGVDVRVVIGMEQAMEFVREVCGEHGKS